MDLFSALIALLIFAALLGGMLSWSHSSRIRRMESRVRDLEDQLKILAQASLESARRAPPAEPTVKRQTEPVSPTPPTPSDLRPATTSSQPDTPDDFVSHTEPRWAELASTHLKQNWMIWLGGLCVGLAGIFLVRYSIEMGLLGPTARILLAITTGIVLHGAAEWLRRRSGGVQPALAALAGGASITLYAAVLAALRLYDMLSPGTTFMLLAVVAMATMALSLLHGPVLAIIGLLGAYAVPPLVSDGSGQFLIVLIYSLIISAAAMLLTRYVYRAWFWAGMLAGSLGWWLLSFSSTDVEGFRGFYLAALAYGMLAIPSFNWLLTAATGGPAPAREIFLRTPRFTLNLLQISLVLIALAQGMSIVHTGFSADALLLWSPLVLVALYGARAFPELAFLPWLVLASQWLGWLACGLEFNDGGLALSVSTIGQQHFLLYASGAAVLYSALSWWLARGSAFRHTTFSMITMAPLCWLALAYTLVSELSVDWRWSMVGIAFGLAYLYLSRNKLQRNQPEYALWLILGGHLAYSLAAAMLLREATLTLALATQVISLCWLINRFELRGLDWLVKLILGLVLLRLTFNPWLLRYPTDIHWSLWSYGGSALCVYLAMLKTAPEAPLRRWLAAACAQLVVLFVAAETRYLLYDGEIFRREYSFTEAAINSSLWGALGLAYHWRSLNAQVLQRVYSIAAKVLLLAAAINQLLLLSAMNPLWAGHEVGSTPIFNLLLLAYGAPVLIAWLVYRYYHPVQHDPAQRRLAGGLGAVSLLMLVSLQIRHLWQGAVDIDLPTSDGELYTYSIAWLVMAVCAILYAGSQRRDIYLAGMSLLLAVIAKLFLVDMSGQEGLWRVASFMGLGLSLLGLAYLYQKQVNKAQVESET